MIMFEESDEPRLTFKAGLRAYKTGQTNLACAWRQAQREQQGQLMSDSSTVLKDSSGTCHLCRCRGSQLDNFEVACSSCDCLCLCRGMFLMLLVANIIGLHHLHYVMMVLPSKRERHA